jgi:hypothetical protein
MKSIRILCMLVLVLGQASCQYVRLLRPSVLKQLNPRVVRLVNELPATDEVNEALIGRLFAHGALFRSNGAARPMRAMDRLTGSR